MSHGRPLPPATPPASGAAPATPTGSTRPATNATADMVERVRAAIASACARQAQSRSLLAQAEAAVSGARRQRQDSAALRAELRASVEVYVRSLRSGGLPAERVVVLVKGVVRDATPDGVDVGDARDLLDDVVRWSIEVYYAA